MLALSGSSSNRWTFRYNDFAGGGMTFRDLTVLRGGDEWPFENIKFQLETSYWSLDAFDRTSS